MLRTIKGVIYYHLDLARRAYRKIGRIIVKRCCYMLPLQPQKVLFINFNGKGFGCNPKYIAQEMLTRNAAYDLVWLLNNFNDPLPDGIRKVKYISAKALYELATAKVIVTNIKNDLRLIKKKDQYVIQTWHGSFSLKAVEAQAAGKLSPRYLEESKKNSAQTDLFLSNSKWMSNCYREAFWCECEIMECGFPRNDRLFTQDPQTINRIWDALNIPRDYKLALYAPTFRDNGTTDAYSIDCKGILKCLNKGAEKWKLLIRLHPNLTMVQGLFPFDEDIIDVTSYPDMQDLLLLSTVLITDYSSTIFDFAAMKKQSYIYAPDIEEYKKLRGLTPMFFNLPNKICQTNEELLNEMQLYSPETAEEPAIRLMKMIGAVDDGFAAKRVADRIDQVISGKNPTNAS